MKSLTDHFKDFMSEQIRESKWFKTAPIKLQHSAVINILGVEIHTRNTLMNGSYECACLIAECKCGDEVQRFSLNLESGESVRMIEAHWA